MSFPFVEPGLRAALAARFPRRDGVVDVAVGDAVVGAVDGEHAAKSKRPLQWFGASPAVCPTRTADAGDAASPDTPLTIYPG